MDTDACKIWLDATDQSTAYQPETGNPINRSSCTYGYWGTESSGAANFCGPISIDNHHPGFHHAPVKVSSGHVEASRGHSAWRGGGWVINRRSARGMLLRPKFQKRQKAEEKRQVVFQVGILVAMATGAPAEMLGIFFSSRNYSDRNLINSKVLALYFLFNSLPS